MKTMLAFEQEGKKGVISCHLHSFALLSCVLLLLGTDDAACLGEEILQSVEAEDGGA